MTDAVALLLATLLLVGLSIILVSFMTFNYRARKAMVVDASMKRRTLRWAAVGSAWSGATFGLITFLIVDNSLEVGFSALGSVAIALLVGIAWSVFLLGGVLLSIYWLQEVTLPLLRKQNSENSQ